MLIKTNKIMTQENVVLPDENPEKFRTTFDPSQIRVVPPGASLLVNDWFRHAKNERLRRSLGSLSF